MRLEKFLSARNLSVPAFAGQIGVSAEAVRRYVKGMRIPEREMMRKIVAATEGQVTPNDFFDTPPSPDAEVAA